MIAEFLANGYLPPGIHWATWQEFTKRFGTTSHRLRLIAGLRLALSSLKAAGCRTVYIDGSFVTTKEAPGDFDACWDPGGVDIGLLMQLEPTLFRFDNRRAAQKARFGGEFFPANLPASNNGEIFLEFFQADREGNAKGIIALDLRSLKL